MIWIILLLQLLFTEGSSGNEDSNPGLTPAVMADRITQAAEFFRGGSDPERRSIAEELASQLAEIERNRAVHSETDANDLLAAEFQSGYSSSN